MTIQLNGTPLPNFQSGNIIAQMYTHPVVVPQTYTGDVSYAYNTQMNTMQSCLGTDQFFNRKKQGQIKPFTDFTGFTTDPATPTVGQQVYFLVPLKNLWTFYQQPGRLFTNDAKLRFNLVLSGLTMRGTQIRSSPSNFAGEIIGTVSGSLSNTEIPNLSILSQPVNFTMTDMYMVMPMYNTTEQLNHQITAIVAERPLSFLMNNVEVYSDPAYQNVDLSVATNWGKGPNRILLKGSGYLPHHVIGVPTATVTWGSRTYGATPTACWPFGIANLVWTRTCIMPGWLYYRRILLGGQPYYDDQLLQMWGVNSVLAGLGGWTRFVEKRTRLLQQQGNYLDAPDQMWLNGYQNATQLAPCMQQDSSFLSNNPTVSIGKCETAMKLAMWMMGCGVNGIPLSQDPSFDTLAESRQQSLEVETFSMPYWADMYNVTDTNNCLLPFMACDSVWYGLPPSAVVGANTAIAGIPTGCQMNVQHSLPYAMMVDYGRGRSTQYAFLQPSMESTTNVPM